jgi:PAS domain S-box-containing protein
MGVLRTASSPPHHDAVAAHVDALPVGVVETDRQGLIVVWEGAASRIFGWSSAEAMGKSLEALNLVFEADVGFVEAVMERLRTGLERQLTHRNRNRTRTGEPRHCEWAHTVIPGRNGRVGSLLSFVTDVTAEVEADAASQRNVALLQAWSAASPEGFCAVDGEWRIVQWNPSAERMFERRRAEVAGRVLWEVFPRLRGTVFEVAFEEAKADGHSRTMEERSPDAPFWYTVTAAPVGDGLVIFFRDVTGRRQLEQELLAAYSELEHARHRADRGLRPER